MNYVASVPYVTFFPHKPQPPLFLPLFSLVSITAIPFSLAAINFWLTNFRECKTMPPASYWNYQRQITFPITLHLSIGFQLMQGFITRSPLSLTTLFDSTPLSTFPIFSPSKCQLRPCDLLLINSPSLSRPSELWLSATNHFHTPLPQCGIPSPSQSVPPILSPPSKVHSRPTCLAQRMAMPSRGLSCGCAYVCLYACVNIQFSILDVCYCSWCVYLLFVYLILYWAMSSHSERYGT